MGEKVIPILVNQLRHAAFQVKTVNSKWFILGTVTLVTSRAAIGSTDALVRDSNTTLPRFTWFPEGRVLGNC